MNGVAPTAVVLGLAALPGWCVGPHGDGNPHGGVLKDTETDSNRAQKMVKTARLLGLHGKQTLILTAACSGLRQLLAGR